MSNFLAIATVTATLQSILLTAVGADVPGATATTLRPDGSDSGLPNPGVNIYLYQVTPNTAWRNADLVTRSSDGRLVNRPRVALDLHYLLTFYGAEGQLEPQRVLGSAVRTLHAQPVLSRDIIQSTIAGTAPIINSNLDEEVELVKLMPLSLSLEELSKLWSVFFQTAYTLSTAYLATTVLIEAEKAPQRALPVQVRNLTVVPFQQAVIDEVVSAADDSAPILYGDTVLIKGQRLRGSLKSVRVGEVDLTPDSIGNQEIQVSLTGADLRAGVQGVQVLYEHGGGSNVSPLVLHPLISKDLADNYEIGVADVTTDPDDGTRAATVTANLAPDVGPRQQVALFLNEVPPSTQPVRAYTFRAEPRTAAANSVTFKISGVEAGSYLVRVQVAGAETLLETDGSGSYTAPQLTIP